MYLTGYGYYRSCKTLISARTLRYSSFSQSSLSLQRLRARQLTFSPFYHSINHYSTQSKATLGDVDQKNQKDIPTASQPRLHDSPVPSGGGKQGNIYYAQPQRNPTFEPQSAWSRDQSPQTSTKVTSKSSACYDQRKELRHPDYGKVKPDRLLVHRVLTDGIRDFRDWRVALEVLEVHIDGQGIKTSENKQRSPCRVELRSLVRRVESRSPYSGHFESAQDVPAPGTWSRQSFIRYIVNVTESQNVPATSSQLLRFPENITSNIEIASKILTDLLYDPAMEKHLTVEACEHALRFYYKYAMMSSARALCIRMETLFLELRPSTLNIMLKGAAWKKDLLSFNFLLQNMIRRNINPDPQTWVYLLMTVDSAVPRAVIVGKMRARSMLDDMEIRRKVAATVVPDELRTALQARMPFSDFLRFMDERYGLGWLSESAGHSILSKSCTRLSLVDSLSLLNHMKERGFTPDDISLKIILRQFLKMGQFDEVVEIFKVLYDQHGLSPGRFTYETVFLRAWESRLLNFARVIWRSACTRGGVTFLMKNVVFQSLLTGKFREHSFSWAARHDQIFHEIAGRFVTGIDVPQDTMLTELSRIFRSPISDKRQQSIKWAQLWLKNNLLQAGSCSLTSNLHELLREALARDREWTSEGLGRKNDLPIMLERGIQVGITYNIAKTPRHYRT